MQLQENDVIGIVRAVSLPWDLTGNYDLYVYSLRKYTSQNLPIIQIDDDEIHVVVSDEEDENADDKVILDPLDSNVDGDIGIQLSEEFNAEIKKQIQDVDEYQTYGVNINEGPTVSTIGLEVRASTSSSRYFGQVEDVVSDKGLRKSPIKNKEGRFGKVQHRTSSLTDIAQKIKDIEYELSQEIPKSHRKNRIRQLKKLRKRLAEPKLTPRIHHLENVVLDKIQHADRLTNALRETKEETDNLKRKHKKLKREAGNLKKTNQMYVDMISKVKDTQLQLKATYEVDIRQVSGVNYGQNT